MMAVFEFLYQQENLKQKESLENKYEEYESHKHKE